MLTRYFLATPGTLSRPSLIIRCQIANQSCSFRVVIDKPISQHRVTGSFVPFLTRVLNRTWRHAEFFLLVSDNLYVSQRSRPEFVEFLKNVPFLRCDQRKDDEISSHAILIPDFRIQDVKYANELIEIQNASDAIPFEQRVEIIKWRGRLTGPDYPNLENCPDFPRYALLMMSVKHPHILDARLTTYDNISDSESAAALRWRLQRLFGSPAEKLSAESFVRHKYLISVDGVISAWKRVPTILASGSVLLLQYRWEQFFYPGLKPWVHFVPLKDDFSDLIERYEWLLAHPHEAKIIAENGQHFAREILCPTALETFFAEIVKKCSELYIA
jgi:hypothetical protein